MILDEDCDTEYPSELEEDEAGIFDPLHPQKVTTILASVHVARLMAPLAQLFRSLCIPYEALLRFEARLKNCLQTFPPCLQPDSSHPLDPLTISPILYYQNVRLLLYRHNMSPACSNDQRAAAIDSCAQTAQDTARIFHRCFSLSQSKEHTDAKVKLAATSLSCTHVWRCLLVLAFRQMWEPFRILLRVSMLVGDSKAVNTSCGRHLSLFLQKLIVHWQHNRFANIDSDEELLVLLSGDLQAGTSSWLWGESETGTFLSRRLKHSKGSYISATNAASATQADQSRYWNSTLTQEEMREWVGWSKINEAALWLEEALQNEVQTTRMSIESGRTETFQSVGDQYISASMNSSARSRMAIASITEQ